MTVFEKIKAMSKEEMIDMFASMDEHETLFGPLYCNNICKDRVPVIGCIYPEDVDSPCMRMTNKENIEAWLDSNYPPLKYNEE